ncbi:MAG TPA: hypothetical protein VN026_17855 [Bacteroidia bacterium]|jgi:hypothetical protein|nr:hypothetical protein [Bacteroidia bacterium]
MENQVSLVEVLFERTGNYAKNSLELYKLKAINKSADVISSLAVRIVVISVVALFFIILNIGVALWIGENLGKDYYGFFIVSGFYALVGLLLFTFRNILIKRPVRDSIIMQALN